MAETAAFCSPVMADIPLIEATLIETTDSTILPTHSLLQVDLQVTQPEVQKKKRQRRAQAPPTSIVLIPAAICNLEISAPPPSSIVDDVGDGALLNTSDLPDCVPLLTGADQLPGLEVPRSRGKNSKYSSGYDAELLEGSLSKAATRMRKYRADHRHDVEWLAREAERMRNMRAARKAGAGGVKEEKPKREKAVRKKREKNSLSDLAPAEKFNHEEYLRKEAERVRKYRALKQLDPEWKKNDSDRMRQYRAKRKIDAGLKTVQSLLGEPSDDIPDDLLVPLNHVPQSVPQHQLMPGTLTEDVKVEDTDSEDEAQV